jgi:hypothetical protein
MLVGVATGLRAGQPRKESQFVMCRNGTCVTAMEIQLHFVSCLSKIQHSKQYFSHDRQGPIRVP